MLGVTPPGIYRPALSTIMKSSILAAAGLGFITPILATGWNFDASNRNWDASEDRDWTPPVCSKQQAATSLFQKKSCVSSSLPSSKFSEVAAPGRLLLPGCSICRVAVPWLPISRHCFLLE